MEAKDMKYTIELEVEKNVKAELESRRMQRSLVMFFVLTLGMMIGYIVAHV